MRNTALLEATMAQIREHPELHNQEHFFTETDCGTAGCFAGWALMLSGYTKATPTPLAGVISPNGDWLGAWQSAEDLLGLTPAEAGALFSPANSRKALELMVEDLVNGSELMSGDYYRALVL